MRASREASWAFILLSVMPLLVSVASPALAGGQLDTEVGTLRVQDSFGSDCGHSIAGFCAFNTTGEEEGLGGTFVNAHQRLDYVGLATDFSSVRGTAGDLWLLPDQSIMIRGSDIWQPIPAVAIVSEAWQNASSAAWPEDRYQVLLTGENATVRYYGPSTTDPATFEDKYWTPESWNDDDCIDYDRVGPCNVWPTNTSDNYTNIGVGYVCERVDAQGLCPAVVGGGVAVFQETTPNALVGAELYSTQAATDPSLLTPPPGETAAASSEPPSVRTRARSIHFALQPAGDPATMPPDPPSDALVPPTPEHRPPLSTPPRPPAETAGKTIGGTTVPPSVPVAAIVASATVVAGLIAAAAFYSRFRSKEELLTSGVRQKLLAIVADRPGIHLAGLAGELGLDARTVVHHAKLLVKRRLLVTHDGAWKTRYTLPGSSIEDHPQGISAVLSSPVAARILSAATAGPDGITREDLHTRLSDTPKRTRNYWLRRVLDARLLAEVRQAGTTRLVPTQREASAAADAAAYP